MLNIKDLCSCKKTVEKNKNYLVIGLKMNKSICKLIAIICLSLITLNANAKPIMVNGSTNCGDWVANLDVQKKSWLLGYLSGLAVGRQQDILKETSNESIFLWMDNYCKANPLENVIHAGNILSYELKKQKDLK